MGNILVIYTSMTGNTELIARIIHDHLKHIGFTVTMRSFDEGFLDPEEFLDYDGILFGTYTYEDGDLPYEVEDFYEEMEGLDLTGKAVGVFGSGDTFYQTFGNAVDTIAERFKELGAEVLGQKLKVDLDPDEEDEQRCLIFVNQFQSLVSKRSHAVMNKRKGVWIGTGSVWEKKY